MQVSLSVSGNISREYGNYTNWWHKTHAILTLISLYQDTQKALWVVSYNQLMENETPHGCVNLLYECKLHTGCFCSRETLSDSQRLVRQNTPLMVTGIHSDLVIYFLCRENDSRIFVNSKEVPKALLMGQETDQTKLGKFRKVCGRSM